MVIRAALLALLLAAPATATTYRATWLPSPGQDPLDPVATYQVYACVGTSLACPAYDGSVAWHLLATFPASACATSPCAGTVSINTSQSPVTFAMTATSGAGLQSASSNTVTKPPTASTTTTSTSVSTTSSTSSTTTTSTTATTRPQAPQSFQLARGRWTPRG